MAHDVKLAALTESMLEGTITFWRKKQGERVTAGEILYEVETDKATVEVESPISGVLLDILVQPGSTASVGDVLAMIGELEEAQQTPSEPGAAPQASAVVQEAIRKSPEARPAGPPISPAARRIAKEQNVNVGEIPGTGPNGLVTAEDVKQYIARQQPASRAGAAQSTKYGPEEVTPLKGIRKSIAEKMSTSHREIPQVTTFTEVDMTPLLEFREQHDFSITTFIAMATVMAIQEYPAVNSSLSDNQIHVKRYINLGIAAATEEGLTVPVIHNAERLTLAEIGEKIAVLSEKAKNHRLGLEDVSDGTFTVSNSGVFGSLFFTPIINYPESAILGVGNITKRPVVVQGEILIRSMMYLGVSYDHRIIDGAIAVRFLKAIKDGLENPGHLLSTQGAGNIRS